MITRVKTKVNQLRAVDDLMDYLKGRSDFAKSEDEHVDASKAIVRLMDVRKLLNALPEEKPENIDTL
jgi:hypothetical protein